MALLAALDDQPGFAWLGEGAALATLTGTKQTLDVVRSVDAPSSAPLVDPAEIEAWRAARKPALLYD